MTQSEASDRQHQLDQIQVILATDCGSTTTKARMFKKLGKEYRFVASGEAPTTVEAPYEDITLGVRNAVREIEELTGHNLLSNEGVKVPYDGKEGTDIYLTTSSAGGGLQMMVAGVVKTMTAESAERAALGAGAIVMDTVATDDGRTAHSKIQRIRQLRPDMILMAGGTDGGTMTQIVEVAELIASAEPQARLGAEYKLPIVYAGNKDARKHVGDILSKFEVEIVDNIRPVLETENLDAAREAIHELFMEHVMSHAPGYNKLMQWTDVPIMPTPGAEGRMFRTIAELRKINVIGVGLGGATTNVYSVYDEKFVRTVSANLGMSYSICNVLKEAGIGNIMRWIPFPADEITIRNRLRNKMIRPTTIPETIDELVVEHAVAREALRLGFKHHKSLARGLRGVQRRRTVADIFEQTMDLESYIDMMKINLIAGTGGLLSRAPWRAQAALILIDGFQPEGITLLAQDSIFMIPHLGLLSTVHPTAALEIFEKDCLIKLGTCIAPKSPETVKGSEVMVVTMRMPDGSERTETLNLGQLKRVPLKEGEKAQLQVRPIGDYDVGAGPGRQHEVEVEGGIVGIVLDARGRPIVLPESRSELRTKVLEWYSALEAYPVESLEGWKQRT